MPPDWLPSFPFDFSGQQTPSLEGVGNSPWSTVGLLVLVWLLFIPVFFVITGLILDHFGLALILSPFFALAAAAGFAYWRDWQGPLNRARETSPLWARLLFPIPIFAVLFPIAFVGFGFFISNFTLLALGAGLLALAGTVGVVIVLGFWSDVPERVYQSPIWVRLLFPLPLLAALVGLGFILFGGLINDFRFLLLASLALATAITAAIVSLTGLWYGTGTRVTNSSNAERLAGITAFSVLSGLLVFLAVLVALEQVEFALAGFLPGSLLGGGAFGFLLGWFPDAHEELVGWHFGTRIGVFFGLLVLLTMYFALLVGPFLPSALIGYGLALVIALLLAVPFSVWIDTWTDTWGTFVNLGEDRRFLATLPIFPLGAVAFFLILAFTTGSFAVAYMLSIPLGLGLFLLAGLPFGVTQDIPGLVRRRALPARVGIFALFFLLVTAYAYFAVALFVQIVELALIVGVLFSGLVLGGLIVWLDLAEGLREEFETYPAMVEAGLLSIAFLVSLFLAFVAVALATGDFRAAFLVSVFAAAGLTYLIAHTTGLVSGIRETVKELPWWGELAALLGVFGLAFVYGTVAVGIFAVPIELALLLGTLFAVGALFALSQDLKLGRGMLDTADEESAARIPLLVLTFLSAFLVGMYVSALLLDVVGVSLFGLPLFVSLVLGTAAAMGLARWRSWDEEVVARVQTGRDKMKTLVILALWLGLGILTGFALQAVPIEGPILGLGDATGLPLALTLAVGLIVWAWLPMVLFQVTRVSRTPVDATLSMTEKHRTLASIAWGLLVFGAAAVVALTVLENPVLAVGIALALGYLTAILLSARGGQEPEEG